MVNIGKWTRSILMPEIGELNGEIKATDTKVESLEKNMNIRFDAVDISLGAVETNMETKIGALEKVTNSRFNQLEGKIDLILVKVDSARKFAEIEERLSKLETRN